jgi:hypothetical protein
MLYNSSTASKIAPELHIRHSAARSCQELARALPLRSAAAGPATSRRRQQLQTQPVHARHTVLSGRLPKAVRLRPYRSAFERLDFVFMGKRRGWICIHRAGLA